MNIFRLLAIITVFICLSASMATAQQKPTSPLIQAAAKLLVSGKVVDQDGSPTAGVSVSYYSMQDTGEWKRITNVITDNDGAFKIYYSGTDKTESNPTIIAKTNGFVTMDILPHEHQQSEFPISGMTLVLNPETSIRVRAIGIDKNPLPNRILSIQQISHEYGFRATFKNGEIIWQAKTDANGWAMFKGLPQGYIALIGTGDVSYRMLASHPEINLERKSVSTEKTIIIDKGHSISGLAIEEKTGKPVKGIYVHAYRDDKQFTGYSQPTSGDGNFVIPALLPGTYTLIYQDYGSDVDLVNLPTKATLQPGSDTVNVKFYFTKGGFITGKVTDKTTHKPVHLMPIYFVDEHLKTYSTSTGRDGTYKLRCLEGRHNLRITFAKSPESEERNVEVKYGETTQLNFEVTDPAPEMTITGNVIDQDGKPVSNAEILLVPAQIRTQSNSDGIYSFTITQKLNTENLIYACFGKSASKAPVKVNSDGTATITLFDNAMTTLTGKVLDQDGKPIKNAQVIVYFEINDRFDITMDTMTTDANGEYVSTKLFPNSLYMACAKYEGYGTQFTKHFMTSSNIINQDITLQLADSYVDGIILDPKGNPVAGAKISVVDVDGGITTTTYKNGKFHLNNVPRRFTTLSVVAPEHRQATVTIPSGTDGNTIIVKSDIEWLTEPIKIQVIVRLMLSLFPAIPLNPG